MLRVLDLSSEQSGSRAVLLCIFEQMKGIVRRAARAAENSRHEMRIVRDQLLHRARAVIDHLQEERTRRARNASERACDQVVDESPDVGRAVVTARVGIENLQEMPKALRFSLDAEISIRLKRCVIELQPIVGRDRIESEIRAAVSLNLIDRRRSKRPRRLARITSARGQMNVGCIVCTYAWRDR